MWNMHTVGPLSNEEEQATDTCHRRDEPQNVYGKQKQPDKMTTNCMTQCKCEVPREGNRILSGQKAH